MIACAGQYRPIIVGVPKAVSRPEKQPSRAVLLPLEPGVLRLQAAAVFSGRTHEVLRHAVQDVRLDFVRQLQVCAHQAGEVGD